MMPFVIDDSNYQEFLQWIESKGYGRGLLKRDYAAQPVGCEAAAEPFPDSLLIPEVEWKERLAEQQAKKTSLFDLREANYSVLKSLDQNGYGLCWAFSSTKAAMYVRALQNQPVRLAAYWVAGKIKGWRDQGGWGLESLKFLANQGAPEESFCPNYRSSNDTSECRENAAKHVCTEWWDGSDNRDKARHQMISMFLRSEAPVLDLDWMGHSMCGCRLVSIDPLIVDADNSWGESSGDKGLYRLQGGRAIPDGLVCPRVMTPSA